MADNVAITAGSGTSIAADDVSSVYYQKIKLDIGGDGVSLPVSSTANAIPVKALDNAITITCSLDTNAYADGDVLFETQEIAGAVNTAGDVCILQSVTVADISDQGQGLDLIFFNAATSLGTENAAPDIDDTEVLTVIGRVQVGAGSFYDLGGCRVACVYGIGLPLKSGASTSLYVAGVSRGAGTYAAAGLQIKFGFLRN